jgi:membrane-associated protease RseP (regulator of RpoE activity)
MMDWLLILVVLVVIYAVVAYIVHRNNLWADHIVFYGPIMAIKTRRVQFFDRFTALLTFFRLYGTAGVIAVVIVSVFMTVMLVLSIRYTLIVRPEPTGIYEPQNILLLPGINDYVPSTFAVWFAFFLTIVVHEFGHAILCRVEEIKVKGMGVLLAVIPIGFFVEPDEEELEKTKGMPKVRMFGAGITNNLVVGFSCFVLLILLFGLVHPSTQPVVHGIYKGYPADNASLPQGAVVTVINGIPVTSRTDVESILNTTKPGDTITLTAKMGGVSSNYRITLAAWPAGDNTGETSGFMGIEYYDGATVKSAVGSMLSPVGFFEFLIVPFASGDGMQYLRLLAFDSPDTSYYQVPFAGFWDAIHLLFWCGWININVGLFNAIPMIPLDGGYILKEGVDRLLDRRGLIRYSGYVVGAISYVMIVFLVSLVVLPYLLHM